MSTASCDKPSLTEAMDAVNAYLATYGGIPLVESDAQHIDDTPRIDDTSRIVVPLCCGDPSPSTPTTPIEPLYPCAVVRITTPHQ